MSDNREGWLFRACIRCIYSRIELVLTFFR